MGKHDQEAEAGSVGRSLCCGSHGGGGGQSLQSQQGPKVSKHRIQKTKTWLTHIRPAKYSCTGCSWHKISGQGGKWSWNSGGAPFASRAHRNASRPWLFLKSTKAPHGLAEAYDGTSPRLLFYIICDYLSYLCLPEWTVSSKDARTSSVFPARLEAPRDQRSVFFFFFSGHF